MRSILVAILAVTVLLGSSICVTISLLDQARAQAKVESAMPSAPAMLAAVPATTLTPAPLPESKQLERIANSLERIATSLEILAKTRKADVTVR